MQIPPIPTDCVPGTKYVLVATCGSTDLTWELGSSIAQGSALVAGCADCGKAAVVKAMVDKGMSAKDIAVVLKAMG